MKKILLLAGLLFTGLTQAQLIEVTTYGGAPIEDGQVFEYNVLYDFETSPHTANLPIFIENISDQTLNLKLRMDSMENANGNEDYVSFCFAGTCYFNVQNQSIVPSTGNGATLAPGETTNPGDHFFNSYPGDVAGQPVVYNFSIVQVDNSGAVMGDALISFTYKYDSTLGIDDLTSLGNMGITVENTLVKNSIRVNTSQQATMEVYDLAGKLLKTAKLNEGSQTIDLSGLSAAVYIAKFTTTSNQSSSTRIVKQ